MARPRSLALWVLALISERRWCARARGAPQRLPVQGCSTDGTSSRGAHPAHSGALELRHPWGDLTVCTPNRNVLAIIRVEPPQTVQSALSVFSRGAQREHSSRQGISCADGGGGRNGGHHGRPDGRRVRGPGSHQDRADYLGNRGSSFRIRNVAPGFPGSRRPAERRGRHRRAQDHSPGVQRPGQSHNRRHGRAAGDLRRCHRPGQ